MSVSVMPAAQEALLAAGRMRDFHRGEVLFHQGDPCDSLYLLRRGLVAVRASTAMGDEVTLSLLSAPDEFGEMGLLRSDHHHTATVQALGAVRVVVVPATRFNDLRRAAHPELTEWLLRRLVSRLERSSELLADSYFLDADQRIARRLLDCMDACGEPRSGELPLTQVDVAAMAGVSRPTANRMLRRLERAGVLRLHRRRIEIVDAGALQHVAG